MAKKKKSNKKDKKEDKKEGKKEEKEEEKEEEDEEDLFGLDDDEKDKDEEKEEEPEEEEDEEPEEEEKPKPKKKKEKKKGKGKQMDKSQMFFFGGAALAVISVMLAIMGTLLLMKVNSYGNDSFIDNMGDLSIFTYGCCLLTMFFGALAVGGIILVLKSLQPVSPTPKSDK